MDELLSNLLLKIEVSDLEESSDLLKKHILQNPSRFNVNKIYLSSICISIRDENIKKEILENFKDYNLSNTDVAYVLSDINDDDFKKKLLLEKEKYGFDFDDIRFICKNIKDEKILLDIIDNYKNYNLNSNDIYELSLKLSDESKKILVLNYKKYNLLGFDVSSICIRINDQDFLKYVVDNYKKFDLYPIDAAEICSKITDDYYKLVFFENNERRLSAYAKITLAESMISEEYKKLVIANYKRFSLKGNNIENILISMADEEYIFSIIDENNEMLDNYLIIRLSGKLSEEYIKKIIKNHEKYNLTLFETVMVCRDDSLKLELINNPLDYNLSHEYVLEIIRSLSEDLKFNVIMQHRLYNLDNNDIFGILKDVDEEHRHFFAKQYKDFGFTPYQFEYMIGDYYDDFKKELLEEREKIGLEKEYLVRTCFLICDEDYKREIIDNYKEYGLDSYGLAVLVSSIKDDDFKKDFIEKEYIYQFSDIELLLIICSLSNQDYKEQLLKEKHQYDYPQYFLKLPEGMTIGMEIEAENGFAPYLANHEIIRGWISESDGSLSDGVEIKSPPITSDSSYEQDIVKVTSLMKKFGLNISDNCGGHVHVGADYFEDDPNIYKSLLEIYGNAERILYLISNPPGQIPRDGVINFAPPISKKLENALLEGRINSDKAVTFNSLINELKLIQCIRYSGLNFQNIGSLNKNTIEFRISNGSIDPKVWVENANLFGGLVKAAKELTIIEQKNIDDLSLKETRMFLEYERIRSDRYSDKEKLDALLYLTISKEDRDIYRKRYEENKKLITGKKLQAEIINNVSNKPIKITKLDMEKETMLSHGDKILSKLISDELINKGVDTDAKKRK